MITSSGDAAAPAVRPPTQPHYTGISLLREAFHYWRLGISEVLALQPADVQLFLLSTSFLTRLTGSLCDAVTGRNDSALVLERLELVNLFTVPLGSSNRQRWYRYYALFAEAMRQYAWQRLSEADIALLHERASRWYEAHGELDDAVEEAIAAGQPVRAATLIESFFDRGGYNELYTLRRWVEQLPDDVLHEHPLICLAYAKAILFTSDRYAPATAVLVERWAQLAEQTWCREQNAPRLGQVASLRAMVALWQGDAPGSFSYARQALELLAEDDITNRSVGLLIVGQEELLAGRIAAAQRFAIEAHTLYEVDRNMDGTLAATALLAELYNQQGEFEQAAQCYQRILDEAIGGEQMLDDQGDALCGLSALAYERDDLETAERQAMRAIELAKQRHYEALQVQATLILSRVQYARGQTVDAWHELQSLAVQTRGPSLLREIQSRQARLALAMSDLEFAQRWHANITAQRDPAARLQQEREALIGARLQLAQGNPQAALEILEGWRAEASAQGRIRSEIEILILQALAHLAHADRVRAEQALIRALLLGQPRGYRRIFLDEGEPLATLLRAIAPNLSQRPLATYAASLLRTLTPSSATAAQVAGLPLLEPLSQQELRVLRLIVAGQSNVEIARELVVSTNTIKTHIKNIYRKLNVSTREEARDAARELKLR